MPTHDPPPMARILGIDSGSGGHVVLVSSEVRGGKSSGQPCSTSRDEAAMTFLLLWLQTIEQSRSEHDQRRRRNEEHGAHLPQSKKSRGCKIHSGMSSQKEQPVAQGGAREEEDPAMCSSCTPSSFCNGDAGCV